MHQEHTLHGGNLRWVLGSPNHEGGSGLDPVPEQGGGISTLGSEKGAQTLGWGTLDGEDPALHRGWPRFPSPLWESMGASTQAAGPQRPWRYNHTC